MAVTLEDIVVDINMVYVRLDQSEVLTLGSSPVEIVPAQGANTVVTALNGFMYLHGAQYGSGAQVWIMSDGASVRPISFHSGRLDFIPDIGNKSAHFNAAGLLANTALVIGTSSDTDPAGEGGELIFEIAYAILDIP